MRSYLRFSCVLGLISMSAPAGAQVEAKDATKQLTSTTKTEMSEAKAAAKTAASTFAAELKTFEETAEADPAAFFADVFTLDPSGAIDEAGGLLNDWNLFLTELINGAASIEAAMITSSDAGGDLVPQLTDLSFADGCFPPGFYAGDQGALDKLGDNLLKNLDKQIASADKKLKKLASAFSKLPAPNRIGMTWQVFRPTDVFVAAPGNGTFTLSDSRPLQFTLVLGIGKLDNASDELDGIICATGSSDDGLGAVTVDVIDSTGAVVSTGAPVPGGSGQFRFCDNDLGTFYPGGNYLLEARQGAGADQQVVRVTVGVPNAGTPAP